MKTLAIFVGAIAFALAASGSYLGASLFADYVEKDARERVEEALKEADFEWVTVTPDGLNVHLSGLAPTEAKRFRAIALGKKVVRSSRIKENISVVEPDSLHAPRFSLELLRNGDGISLIGLIPDATGRSFVLGSIADISEGTEVTDMLETSGYPEPEGWRDSLTYALTNLRSLPRSKISVVPLKVVITAITDSQEEKKATENMLRENLPSGVELVMNISAPRPVITPFSLRLTVDQSGARFDSCSADTEAARKQILAAARAAGVPEEATCTIGLGTPTPNWAKAVVYGIHALGEFGGGSLTFADADITIVAPENTVQADFDRIVHNLEQALPDVFSVRAILPPKPMVEGKKQATEPPEFNAVKSPEGLIQMRGRMRDERSQTAVLNFARAQFGADNVHDTTRVDSSLPDGWSTRILAGLNALSKLHHGMLVVGPDLLDLSGVSDHPEASTEITKILSEELDGKYGIKVDYDEALNPVMILPTPQECVDNINAILGEQQIVFAPSSTKIEGDALKIIERIAEAMTDCSEVPMEIGGHTDSQGRESMNLTLSQARAEAVLDTLLSYDVLTTYLSAKGYGENVPIGDNETEEGRAANRRIEFTLVNPGEGSGDPVTKAEETTEEDPLDQAEDEETEPPEPGSEEALEADSETDPTINTETSQ